MRFGFLRRLTARKPLLSQPPGLVALRLLGRAIFLHRERNVPVLWNLEHRLGAGAKLLDICR